MIVVLARIIAAHRLRRLLSLLQHHQQSAEHHADLARRHRAAVVSITAQISARSAK